MTTTPERRTATLSERVAEEIRAWLGRRRMSQAQLSRQMGQSQMWVSDRLRGIQPIGLDDLQRFAAALDVEVHDLLPSREEAAQAAIPPLTTRRAFKHPYIPVGHSADTERSDPLSPRPIGRGGRPDSTRPRSAPRTTSTRPPNARPSLLPRVS